MSGKSIAFSNDILLLVFNNVAIASLGDAAGVQPSSAAGNVYVALHSGTITTGDDQSKNEISYTGYNRQAVPRNSASGWVVATGIVNPKADISLPTCTAGSATAINFSIGYQAGSTTKIMYFGTLTPAIAISAGVTPTIPTTSSIAET